MGVGIEVYNADGSLQFDIGSRLFRVLSFQTVAGTSGSVTIPGATAQGTIVPMGMVTASTDGVAPAMSVSGNTVSWGAGQASRINVMVY